ncbi:hypothetical protein JCM10914A_29780 [Paenibacillus sp. JCM 10914]|uniref:glycoside hydrolase family protein n=1 Tax=Paenibacillus sp. JCM 10914 TaxID=1236974 RepID=UPI0003CC8643|nr:glycoside hydrolase family protein [Paenibacillus sp. JCM 10914]GAE07108.1 hypothetical protein JCM10914_3319 [Paenibacillus sp. JCM 10914]
MKIVFDPAPIAGGFRIPGYWVWCGSVVHGEDGRYHMFASRWPTSLPMHPGWLAASEIVRAVADQPAGPYRYEETVLGSRSPAYWDGCSVHNPHIVKIDGTYVLYYMGTTFPFPVPDEGQDLRPDDPLAIVARANKRIGIATAPSVTGPWTRRNAPVLLPRPDRFDSFFVSNPAPYVREDGTVQLIYKSRPYVGRSYGNMQLGLARATSAGGPYVRQPEPLFPPAVHIEDPFIWRTPRGYEMIAKDMDGSICGERYGGIHAWSSHGERWEITTTTGHPVYSRQVQWDDGQLRLMGNLERPFLLMEGGRPTWMFAATSDGSNGFHDCTETWNMAIPIRDIIFE